jgi:hypothetical protein
LPTSVKIGIFAALGGLTLIIVILVIVLICKSKKSE